MESDWIDLGFNDEYLDHCDYVDYSMLSYDTKSANTLTVLQLNTHGALNKRDSLMSLFADIKKDNRVDVALLVETWLTKTNTKRFMIPGYKFLGSHRKNKRGGGVGILVSQDMDCRSRDDLSLQVPDFESLTVEIKTHSNSFFVCSIYRPPNSKVREFLKHYRKLLQKFTQAQKERLILGLDHNLNLLKHNIHAPTQEFIDINLDLNLIPTITKPTRITKTSATLLDNIIVGKQFHNFVANIAISDISDHLPTIINSHQPSLYKKQPLTMTTRALNETACAKIIEALNSIDWNQQLLNKPVDDAYTSFHTKTQEILDMISPIKQIKIKPSKIMKDPWMSPGLLKCVQKQKSLYRRFIEKPADHQLAIKYKDYRNKLQQILRKTKENYYKKICKEYKKNTSKLWKVINRITQRMNDKSGVIEYLKVNNIEIHDTNLIAEEFAKHFSTVGNKYANKIQPSNYSFNHYLQQIPQNPRSMYMDPTSKEEIEKLIDKLPNKTSKGNDDISNLLLKRLKYAISGPLEMIFNKSISEGIFPTGMKSADVIPLFKSKEKFLVNNYRPISLLVTISKILEKIIYTRTYKFLCATDQLYQSQYGFRTGHSCENAISKLVGTIAKHKEEKHVSIGVFIDLSKAFDTLNHKMLLNKLDRYGIRGSILDWFKSYLTGRNMRVKCPSNTTGQMNYSSYHNLDYGTLQGSCLGPLLFLLYINDLHQSIDHCNIILFADDTTLLHGHKSLKYLKWMIEDDLSRMIDWFRANLLTINLEKTECLLFPINTTHQQHNQPLDLNIQGQQLLSTHYVKFLGLWIDHNLQWRTHVTTLLSKLKQSINLLKIGNKFMNKASKKILYYGHIYSHITYGLVLWGNMIDNITKSKIQTCMDICFKLITHQAP